MNIRCLSQVAAAILLSAVFNTSTQAQPSAFTYQGRLEDGGNPANGLYDLRFELFKGDIIVQSVGVRTNMATPVSNGLFTAILDFGSGVFDGEDVLMEIRVRTNGASSFTQLLPWHVFDSIPYSIRAGTAAAVNMGSISDPTFIGTTTAAPLQLEVNNQVGLRLEYPAAGSVPNLVGGYGGNSVNSDTEGAVIAGDPLLPSF